MQMPAAIAVQYRAGAFAKYHTLMTDIAAESER